jgi:hypothetical protein
MGVLDVSIGCVMCALLLLFITSSIIIQLWTGCHGYLGSSITTTLQTVYRDNSITSMTLYLGRAISGGISGVSIEYESRGIEDVKTSSISDMGIYAKPINDSDLYHSYVVNFPAFMRASILQEKIISGQVSYPIVLSKKDRVLPIRCPKAVFTFKNPLDATITNKLLAAVGAVRADSLGKDKAVYILEKPELRKIGLLKKAGANPYTSSSATMTNLSGAEAFLYVVDIIVAACSTHYYSTNPEDELCGPEVVEIQDLEDAMEELTVEEKVDMDVDEEGEIQDPATTVVVKKTVTKTITRTEEKISLKRKKITSKSRIIARPSPWYPQNCFGSPSGVPFQDGLVFPYFRGQLQDDTRYFPRTLSKPQWFRACDASDHASVRNAHKRFSKANNDWAKTEAGKILQHHFLAVDMAVESGARPFFVYEHEEYMGFCLLGGGFRVFLHDVWNSPVEAADLQRELSKLSSHSKAITRICEVLSGCQIVTEDAKKATIAKVNGIEDARQLFLAAKQRVVQKSAREKIERYLPDLAFKQTYLPRTAENVVAALEAISDPSVDISELPMYLGPENMWCVDREIEVLSAFGASAPTFINPGGKKIRIPQTKDKDVASIIDPISKKRPLEAIPIYFIKVEVASADMRKIFDSCCISPNQAIRMKKSKCLYLEGEKRDLVWKVLKEMIADKMEKEKRVPVVERGEEESLATGNVLASLIDDFDSDDDEFDD